MTSSQFSIIAKSVVKDRDDSTELLSEEDEYPPEEASPSEDSGVKQYVSLTMRDIPFSMSPFPDGSLREDLRTILWLQPNPKHKGLVVMRRTVSSLPPPPSACLHCIQNYQLM